MMSRLEINSKGCACTVSVAAGPHRRSSSNASHELSNGCILMQGKHQGNAFSSDKSV